MTIDGLFNITVGAFQVHGIDLISLDENGKYQTLFKVLQKILDIFAMVGRLTVKIAEDGMVGQLEDGEYTGVLGMMERNEIDICLFPLSIDIPNPPGQFSPVFTEEEFTISSFRSDSERITQDVICSLESIDWLTRITIITLIITLEICILFLVQTSKQKKNHFLTTLSKAIERVPSTLFGQYFPDRSLVRFFEVLGLFLFMSILNSTLSTETIVGQKEKLPESLSDIIKLNSTPRFFQSGSMIELFEQGVTEDHRNVYTLAKQKGTSKPFPLTFLGGLSAPAPGDAILTSNRMHRVGLLMELALGSPFVKFAHISEPYHKSLQAFLINSRNMTDRLRRKLDSGVMNIFESGITKNHLLKIYDQVMITSGVGINEFMIIRNDMTIQKKGVDFTFRPLSSTGFQGIFKVWFCAIVIIIALEIFLSMIYMYKCNTRK